MTDAEVLRRAAVIMRGRSTKPDGIWTNVFCRLLTDAADKEDAKTREATS